MDQPTYSYPVRILRALARRFPRLHILVNWLRARGGHYLRLMAGRFRPRRLLGTARWLAGTAAELARLRREPRLTVGVEISAFWEPLTGIGWYLYRLLEELADRDDLEIRLYGPSVVQSPDLPRPVVEIPTGPALRPVALEVPDDLLIPRGLLIPLLRRLEPLLIAAHGNRVLFAPNYYLPRRFLLSRAARVATIHDLGWIKVPWTLRPETLAELSERLEHALFEADRLISVSETVRAELDQSGLAAAARVTAIHHGPGQLARVEPGAPPAGTPARYGLHVGTLEPRKNILGLIEAWRHLRRRLPDAPPLVLCGRFGWKVDRIRSAVEQAHSEGWLTHLGYVSESELAALYRDAQVVVFPSLYEGFGLPAIEAQWAGTPLVCSDIPVLREVAGEAALFAPPDSPERLAERVHEVLTDSDLRHRLSSEGRTQAARLSWRRAADLTADVLRRAGGARA